MTNFDVSRIPLLQVTPKNVGWYYVTFYNYAPEKDEVEYFKDWAEYTPNGWEHDYKTCYVCFIHKREGS